MTEENLTEEEKQEQIIIKLHDKIKDLESRTKQLEAWVVLSKTEQKPQESFQESHIVRNLIIIVIIFSIIWGICWVFILKKPIFS